MDNKSDLSPKSSTSTKKKRNKRNGVSELKRKELKKEFIIELLSKDRIARTRVENKILGDYLSAKVAFFTKLKNPDDMPKLEKLVGALNYEFYHKGQSIISFGEEGDKFYILIEGLVGIYKPSYVNKTMKLKDYLNLMNYIKEIEENELKYARIKEKNATVGIDFDFFSKIDPESYALKKDYTVIIEEDEKLGEFTEPFAFGDIALIKRCQRNATIKALIDSKVVSIDKYDYNKILREIEEKRLETQLKDFRKSYPLFQYWNLNQLIRLFNCFSKQILNQGEYLYKQNEISDSIYIVKSGIFEMYSLLSFGWLSEFFNYIITPKQNLIYSLDQAKMPIKEADLMSYYETLIKESEESPCVFDYHKVPKAIPLYEAKEEIDIIRTNHEEMSNPLNLFKVNCRKIDSKEVIGIEDALEIKKRFCFVKCVSKQAEVEKINIYDFLRLMNRKHDDNNRDLLLDMIAKRKLLIFTQLKNGSIQRNKELCIKLTHRFHNLSHIKPTEETKLVVMKLKDKNLFDYSNYRHEIINTLTSPLKKHIQQKSHRISLIESSSTNNFNCAHDQEIMALRSKFSRNLHNRKQGTLIIRKTNDLPRMEKLKYSPFVCITRFNSLASMLTNKNNVIREQYYHSNNSNRMSQKKQASITRDIDNSTTRPMDSSIISLPKNKILIKYFDTLNKDSNKQVDEINDLKKSLSRNNKQFFLSRNYNSSSQRLFQSKSKFSF